MKKFKLWAGIFIIVSVLMICLSSYAAEGDTVVSLQIDNPIMEVNGIDAEIDPGRGTKPLVLNNRTLVPIRAIVEAFGGNVGWEAETNTAVLTMDDDTIRLTVGSNTAYLNGNAQILDVVPTVINDRTMLPIRFVAEGFNLGVAWEGDTQTITVIRNSFEDAEYHRLMQMVPAYSGTASVTINGNKPFFEEYELIGGSFEFYADTDQMGRCDVTFASVAEDIMPTEERGSISSVTPTGWVNVSYDSIPGKYLYNRCHLIGYQLTGENANRRNLITGTRYLNMDGMLPLENAVAEYIKKTGNHVVYRSTPVFSGNNLVADGVLMEAYSVEDNGAGISFCVYCYNIQPGIIINYSDGTSYGSGTQTIPAQTPPSAPVTKRLVYRTPTGKRYHFDPDCGGKNSTIVAIEVAIGAGLTPCQKCAK